MDSDNNSQDDFIQFCSRIDKKKDQSKLVSGKKKPIGAITAKHEDISIRNYDHGLIKPDTLGSIRTLSDETLPYNVGHIAVDNCKKKRVSKKSSYIKSNRNNRVRGRLSILKEKAKQDYFKDLCEVQDQYNKCDSDELEELTINVRNDYDDLSAFLDNEYSSQVKNGGTYTIDKSPRRKVRRVLSYSDASEHDLSKSKRISLSPDMSGFAKECIDKPQGTTKKKQQIQSGMQNLQVPDHNKPCTYDQSVAPTGRPTEDKTYKSNYKKSLRSKRKILKTPLGTPSQLKTVTEIDENRTQSPLCKSPKQMLRSAKRPISLTKIIKYKPRATSTPRVTCQSQSPRDLSLSRLKLPKRVMNKQAGPSNYKSEKTHKSSEQEQKSPKKTFSGLVSKPKFKPITDHNLDMYKKRVHNEYISKVTHAKRTIPVAQRTAVIDNLKKNVNDKLKRIEELPKKQKELDTKYAEDVRKVTAQLHDWTDGRNSELDSLKRNYEIKTSRLVQDFEVADLEEIPKARLKIPLKIPKFNLDEYRERAHADFKKKSDHAKRNVPVSERNNFLCNLQKELDKKLQRIDKIPELVKKLEIRYNEAVAKIENQFADDGELLQEQLEFLKEEYDAKMANLDEDSIIPACFRDSGMRNSLITNKSFDCKRLYDKIGPVLELCQLPKPSETVTTQKDIIKADLERARKLKKTKKQLLSATSKPVESKKIPSRPIQETVKLDKHLARKQLMDAARARAKSLRQKFKAQPSEPLIPTLPSVATANPLRKEGAEDIFNMMLMEREAIDMSKPPKDILEVLIKSDMPKLEIVGNAFEMDGNEIVPLQIPTIDLNQLNELQEEEIAATLKMKQHPPPADGLAAKLLNDKDPIKIPLNKNPDYEPISVPVYLNSYKYEDMFQVRGTTFPKWFPGFYTCGPQEDAPQVILRESPSEILQAAWIGMKPRRCF